MPDRDPAALLRQWWPLVLKLACRYHRWALTDSADDLAGEIAARALRYFPAFDPAKARFSTWLGHVAWSAAALHRQRAIRRPGPAPLAAEVLAVVADSRAADPAALAAERLDRAELTARVRRAFFDRLTADERAALRRRFGLPGDRGPDRTRRVRAGLSGLALEQLRRHVVGAR